MIIVLKPEATATQAAELMDQISALGLTPLHMPGSERVVLGALGDERVLEQLHLDSHPIVESVKPILAPYKLVAREMHPADTVVSLGGVDVGGDRIVVIAGPCAVESLEQMRASGRAAVAAGARILRGGAFKPRTSPYSFQGLGREGLEILKQVSEELGVPTLTEVVDVADVELVDRFADGFQAGARNMQNFRLLKALGQSRKPVRPEAGHGGHGSTTSFSPPNTSWRRGTRTSSSASAGSRPSRPRPATRSTCRPCPRSRRGATCRSSSIPRTGPEFATTWHQWPRPPWPAAPTGC